MSECSALMEVPQISNLASCGCVGNRNIILAFPFDFPNTEAT